MSSQSVPRPTEHNSSTVGVVGVTGTIGSRVARLLADAGHDVVGISRNPAASALYRAVAADCANEAAAQQRSQGSTSFTSRHPRRSGSAW
jgi:nucleoside-diphosphate-sugar epimerase